MNDLISALNSANSDLVTGLSSVRNDMRKAGVTLQTLDSINRIGEWAGEQVPGLQRRRNMAIAMLGTEPTGSMVRFDEPIPFDTPEEAEQYGRQLAKDFLDSQLDSEETYEELMEGFQEFVHDPDVMAGFYLELDPQFVMTLPEYIHQTGSENGSAYLRSFSIGLGTALGTDNYASSSSDYYTELADLREAFRTPTETPALAWGKLALLQDGEFPSRWLADVVRNNVLEEFEQGEHTDFSAFTASVHPKLGLSGDTLALAFGALGTNPSAARIALAEQSDVTLHNYVSWTYGLPDTPARDEVIDAFGQALAAGSGALEEPPDKGHHASSFAYKAILALTWPEQGSSREHGYSPSHTLPVGTPSPMHEHIGTIAGAYAEELLVSSWTELGWEGRTSSMEHRPDGLVLPPGMDPAFYLSPTDVQALLNGIGGDAAHWEPFDEAVLDLFETLPREAVQADIAALEEGEGYTSHLETVMNMFGALEGLQYQALLRTEEGLDEAEEAFRARVGVAYAIFVIMLPGGWGGPAAWGAARKPIEWLVRFFGFVTVSDWVDSAGGRAEAFEHEQLSERYLEDYVAAHLLLDAGYPLETELPGSLFDNDGNLRNPLEIAQDPRLRAEFDAWIASNSATGEADQVKGHDALFGEKLKRVWSAFRSGRDSYPTEIARELA